jgi:hypothetical protein
LYSDSNNGESHGVKVKNISPRFLKKKLTESKKGFNFVKDLELIGDERYSVFKSKNRKSLKLYLK